MASYYDNPDALPPKGIRPPIIGPGQDLGTVTDRIAGVVLTKHTPVFWVAIFVIGLMIAGILLYGFGFIRLVPLIFIFGAHFVLQWLYLFFGSMFLSRSSTATPKGNPFDQSRKSKT